MSESDDAAERAADEVRDELMHPLQSGDYNSGVDEAVERMKNRWEKFG